MSHSSLLSFQRHLKAQGKRPGTVDSYCGIVERFLRSVDGPGESTTPQQIYGFLVERAHVSGRSSSWYNVNFHAMVAWLTMRGLPTDLHGLRPQRVAKQPPRWFTREEVRRLLGAVEQRHFRMVFQVMVATGLRVSEVMALEVADLDRDRPLMRVRCGKGGDGRLVPVGPTLLARLRDYWRSFRPTGVLFQRSPGVDDRPMLTGTVNAALKRAATKAGFSEPISTHRLRHTFAIHSLRGGMDVVSLQKQLGHRCLESTVRYLTPDLVRPGVQVDLLAELGVAP
jgi:site-specific recombinase XerD